MSKNLSGKKLVLGVSGSIAAYKALEVIKNLKKKALEIYVIMTYHATKLVDPKEFEIASGQPIYTSLFLPNLDYHAYIRKDKPIEHISLADRADLILVCPATANVLAKVTHGIADDLLTTTILATAAPIVFCPAMNVKMWKNPLTQENIKRLRSLGYYFVDPEYGELACGYQGVGRLAGNEKITDTVLQLLTKTNALKGKKVIVTAGATQEPIDAVRFITNRSSGKMGAALADTASLLGAEVVLIRGSTAVEPQRFLKEIVVTTADEMLAAIYREIKDTDIVIHSAAVADFTAAKVQEGKIKSDKPLSLALTPKPKILKQLKKLNPKAFIVGFKAEYNVSNAELINRAFKTLQKSACDCIIANDVGKKGRGFGVDTNEVFIVDKEKSAVHLPLASKQKIAEQIIEYIIDRRFNRLND